MADADPAATLAAIKERYRTSFVALPGYSTSPGTPWAHVNSADDVPVLVAALEAALELHQPQDETIYRACTQHALTMTAHDRERFSKMDDCPDCVKAPHQVCAHCDCPNDEWPCPTYLAITREITRKGEPDA